MTQPGTRAGSKDPFTRLLDLTLGWGEYVERDEAEHPDGVLSADVYDAYQSIATFAEPYWDAASEVQEMAARRFVDTRLLPLLFGKSKRSEAPGSVAEGEQDNNDTRHL